MATRRDGRNREEIECELLASVEGAKAEYQKLRNSYFRLLASAEDAGSDTRDGSYAMGRVNTAGKAMHAALGEYREALRRFNRFVIDGKVPGE